MFKYDHFLQIYHVLNEPLFKLKILSYGYIRIFFHKKKNHVFCSFGKLDAFILKQSVNWNPENKFDRSNGSWA